MIRKKYARRYDADLGWGTHPVVIVPHPVRAARKEFVEILDCASQRANRPARDHEVVLSGR
jgi:chemotaxis response regulator CheB